MKARVLLFAAALAAGSFSYAQEPLKVGVIAPFSGPFADYGRQFEGGIKAYMKLTSSPGSALPRKRSRWPTWRPKRRSPWS
jgi:hypothetical protein